MPAPLTNEALFRAYRLTDILRGLGEAEFPLQLAGIFFYVASHDGCLQEEVTEMLSIAHSSCSRNVSWLGDKHRLSHREGLKLVRRERDPDDAKRWRLYLTPKGKTVSRLIEDVMTGN